MSVIDIPMSDDEEYAVERIEKRRILADGRVEYYLKWKNWPAAYNTWEPEEHLNCPGLIEEFLRRERASQSLVSHVENGRDDHRGHRDHHGDANNNDDVDYKTKGGCGDDAAPPNGRTLYRIPKVCGFDRGFEAEKILGATDCNGLTFLIKWKGLNRTELVPSKIARYRCPHLVINFFEQHITWHNAAEIRTYKR